jgi:hypothetical protein
MELNVREKDTEIHSYLSRQTKGFIWESDGVCVFGGALRDIDTGRTPKDVDFLVENTQIDRIIRKLLVEGYTIRKKDRERAQDDNQGYTAVNQWLMNVYSATQEGFADLDILEISCEIGKYMDQLPINSSCIFYARDPGSGWSSKVTRSEDYMDFIIMEQIVISDNRLRSDYLLRLRGYYPTFNVSVDDDNEYVSTRSSSLFDLPIWDNPLLDIFEQSTGTGRVMYTAETASGITGVGSGGVSGTMSTVSGSPIYTGDDV